VLKLKLGVRMSEASVAQDPVRSRIKVRAYEIWLAEGCPSGCELDHWLRAEAEVAGQPASDIEHRAVGVKAE